MGKRHLLWFCVLFVFTAILGAVFQTAIWLIIALAAFAGMLSFILCHIGNRLSAALVIAAITLSLLWQTAFFTLDKLPRGFLANKSGVTCEVSSYATPTSTGGLSFEGVFNFNGRKLCALIYTSENASLSPGDVITADFSFYEFENTSHFAEKTYYKSRYIDIRAYASEIAVADSAGRVSIKYLPEHLAKRFKDTVAGVFDKDTAAFVNSLILGDTSGLSDDFKKALKATGLSHAVSVSGMHISFLMGLFLVFSKNKYIKLAALPLIFLFVLMVGAPQSALRAVIMQAFIVLASFAKREYDQLTALSFAAFVLVAINPYCATDIAFLLSFAATLGIVVLQPKIREGLFGFLPKKKTYLKKIISDVFSMISVSVSATIFSTPLTVCSFGSFSVIGVFANVLLNWLISLVFTAGVLNTFISLAVPPLGAIGAKIIDFLVGFIMSAINAMASLPFAQVLTENPLIIFLICFLCVALIYAVSVGRGKLRIPVLLAAVFLSVVCVFFANMLIAEKAPQGEGIRFDVLDVGQGQCVIATSGDSCAVIDCGGDDDAASAAISHLSSIGVKDIDVLVLTHAHADHANGAEYLVKSVDTKSLYMPATDKENAMFIRLSERAGEGCEKVFVDKDTELELGGITLKLLTLPQGSDENENGLVILVCDGDYETLITGDIATKNEKLVVDRLPDCESYIVGHHGSKSSSSQALLNRALPELAIISVGVGNLYDHPSKETLRRLENIGARVERTDLLGTITFFSREEIGETA